ncbi:Leucine-rich transmembrane protein [Operophtera brumata]|uniref:Leucine-rich transmembrane protein n=1 Tax=Operophtera brumata TaxID=104452 RepID=A0A0L7KXU1_OPEBR|nr:Leucine-rich transmembrane protein [Operophtera brumata]
MGVRYRELLLLAACACALAAPETTNKTIKKDVKDLDNYDDYDSADEVQEVLFNEDRPCPRDCICTVSQGYRIAKCNRLEVGVQKFGEDITDLVIDHADPTNPIKLDDFIFKKLGLHQIATVKIVNSTISYVGPNAFHGLHELYAVNLSNNKLKNLDPETFVTNKKLLLLTLSNNPSLKFPAAGSEKYFLNASSVQELDVSFCNMQYITANTFKNMPGLMYLNVAGNNLSDMDPNTFKKLLDLEELDLSDNNLKSLPDDIFSENTELATLHILKNPIDTVYGLQISDLLTLNAGQTNIKFVGPSMFNGMTYIANLNLSGNSIEKIHNQAFHKLVELNYLDLSFNDLDFMSSILIKENIELDIFKISNNPRLKHLPTDGFECSADQFNIYLFDASNCGLEEIFDNSLKTFTALSVINLSDNKIRTISEKVFSISPKLVEVNLAYNLLTTLNAKVFENNNELGKLNLQGNPLTVLSAEVFSHTPLMTWLDMSRAELTYLWKSGKNHTETLLSNLTFLNVSHNRITEIKQSELDKLNKLRTLDISNNPLACSRDFENLMNWLSTRKVSPNAVSENVANMAKDAKDDDETYSWEFLTRKTCGAALPHAMQLDVKLMDNDVDDLETEEYQEVSTEEQDHGKYEYLWPICIAILGALLLLVILGKIVMMMCSRRTQQIRYNSAIIAAMQAGRTKKDCGLVYQQLSEDLTGPKTPKLSRYQPLQTVTVNASNLSYESSPFHQQNIVPEHV